jgi:hypothetical protein
MRAVCVLLGFAVVLGLVVATNAADEKKEVTLKGTITCAKCDLKLEKACATVIKAKDKDDKEVIYYFDKDSGKKYHKEICQEAKEGEVTGVIGKDGKKATIKVSKVSFK